MKTPFDQTRNNLDAIRVLLALLVTFSHCYPLGVGSEVREPFALLSRGQATGGYIAVDLFFVISGFLIAASAERSASIWRFLKKRVFRIYPAFCLVALMTVVLFMPWGSAKFPSENAGQNAVNVLWHTVCLREFNYQRAFQTNPYPGVINGSLWSISYECWCYLGVALLSITRLLQSKATLISIFAASIAISICFSLSGWRPGGSFLGLIFGYPPFWARLLPMYMAGVVFYKIRDQIPIRTGWIIAAFALLIVAARTPHGWQLMFPLVGTYLTFVAAYHPAIPHLRVTRFGDLSYGTYLYAFPVQQVIVHQIGHTINPLLLFLLATPPTLLLAAGSWYGVERWFLRQSHKEPQNTPIAQELSATREPNVNVG